MNKARLKAIRIVGDEIEFQLAALNLLIAEENEYFDNMPQSIQESEKGDAAYSRIQELEDIAANLESLIEGISNI
jgi:hypothetical protein